MARPWSFDVHPRWLEVRFNDAVATDWQAWHEAYERPGSRLSRRLAVVQGFLAEAIDRAPAGRVGILSLCAGQGRDVLGVVARHPRRANVDAVLVEADPALAAHAANTIDEAGLADHVRVVVGDAGTTSTFASAEAVPADVLLLCGIFGNVTDDDVEHTVRQAATMCAEGATVLWTRHPTPPDLTVRIRQWFAESGFLEVGFEAPDEWNFGVGAHRLVAEPEPFREQRLFAFVD
jgi:hypothetical protein